MMPEYHDGRMAKPHAFERSPHRAPRAPLITFLIATLAVLTAFFTLPIDEEFALQAAAVAATVMALGVAYSAYRSTGNAANPLSLTMIVLIAHYPFHALMTTDSLTSLNLLGFERFEYLTYAVLAATGGMATMYFGFKPTKPGLISRFLRRLDNPVDPLSRVTSIKLGIVLAIAVGSKLVLGASRGFVYLNLEQDATPLPAAFLLWSLGGLVMLVGAYVMLIGLRHRSRLRTIAGLSILGFEALWGLLITGSRYQFMIPVVTVILAWGMAYKPIKLRTLLVMLAVLFLVVVPLSSAYKRAYLSRVGEIQREGISLELITDSLDSTEEAGDDLDGSEDLLALRLHGATSLALIIRYMPEKYEYMWGLPYLYLPVDLAVPRFIWPDKPTVGEFSATFPMVFWNKARDDKSAVKPSQFGVLWANLHIFGVLLGAWLWGRILRFLYSGLQLGGPGSLLGIAAAAAVLPEHIINTPEGDMLQAISGLSKVFVIWLAMTWFLSTKRAPKPHRLGALEPAPHEGHGAPL